MFEKLFGKKKKMQMISPEKSTELRVDIGTAILSLGNAQHQGKRDYQEDSFGFSDISESNLTQKGILAVLADGMGGLTNGKAVSETLVRSMLEWFDTSTCSSGLELKKTIEKINEKICKIYCKDGRIQSGSTIVAVQIKDDKLHWASVGDSRIYLKRSNRIYQLTEDHDYTNQLLDMVICGEMTYEEVATEPQKDSLVACIGKNGLVVRDYTKKGFALEDGDVLILCSDGIYNAVGTDELATMISEDAMKSSEKIIKAVESKDVAHQDNNTVMILSYKKKG